MHYVYAIYNHHANKVYIGETTNIQDRIQFHNNKHFTKSYTARYPGDWRLIYSEEVLDRQAARKRERGS